MPKNKYVTDWSQVPVVVDVPYVSVMLGIHPNTVKKYLRTGIIKGFKVGAEWRICKEEIAAFMGKEETA